MLLTGCMRAHPQGGGDGDRPHPRHPTNSPLVRAHRPISFPLSCLAGVFVVLLHILFVRDHHVGTLILSAANLLGGVWVGVATAGIMVRA